MIIKTSFLSGIRKGKIRLAFRRWKKPTVKTNGWLMTAIGRLHITSVEITDLASITEDEALAAGYASLKELIAELNKRKEGSLYRIEFGELKSDPRVTLRQSSLTADEKIMLKEKLGRMDARAGSPWTRKVLQLIASQPGRRAGDLCKMVNQEKISFKNNVRKLKNLGLTESLDVGYRLSTRGMSYLNSL